MWNCTNAMHAFGNLYWSTCSFFLGEVKRNPIPLSKIQRIDQQGFQIRVFWNRACEWILAFGREKFQRILRESTFSERFEVWLRGRYFQQMIYESRLKPKSEMEVENGGSISWQALMKSTRIQSLVLLAVFEKFEGWNSEVERSFAFQDHL